MEERSWTATVEFDWPAEPDTAAFNGWIAALNGASPAIGYLHRQDGSVLCLASLTVKAATMREAVDTATRMVEDATEARVGGIDVLTTDELDRR